MGAGSARRVLSRPLRKVLIDAGEPPHRRVRAPCHRPAHLADRPGQGRRSVRAGHGRGAIGHRRHVAAPCGSRPSSGASSACRSVSLPQVADRLAGSVPGHDLAELVARAHVRQALRSGQPLTPDPAVAASPATEDALDDHLRRAGPARRPHARCRRGRRAAGRRRSSTCSGSYRDDHRVCRAAGTIAAALAAARVRAGDADGRALGRRRRPPAPARPAGRGRAPRRARRAASRWRPSSAAPASPTPMSSPTSWSSRSAPVLGEARWTGGAARRARAGPPRLVRAPDPAEEVAMAVRRGRRRPHRRPTPRSGPSASPSCTGSATPTSACSTPHSTAAGVPHHAAAVTTLAQTVPGPVLTALLDIVAGGFRRADVAGSGGPGPSSTRSPAGRSGHHGGTASPARPASVAASTSGAPRLAAGHRHARASTSPATGPTSHVDRPTADGTGRRRLTASSQWRAIGAHVEPWPAPSDPPADADLAGMVELARGAARHARAPRRRRQHQPEAFERDRSVLRHARRRSTASRRPPDRRAAPPGARTGARAARARATAGSATA